MPQINAHRPNVLGFTFSPWQCDNLDLPTLPALKQLLKLEPDVIRLGCYWDSMEPKQGEYNFGVLEGQMNEISKSSKHISVILTVGMKAPRWPEFFFPAWIRNDPGINTQRTDAPLDSDQKLAELGTKFALRGVEFAQEIPNIDWVQFENEPFNKLAVTRGRFLSEEYVANLISEGGKIMEGGSQKSLLTYSVSPLPFLEDRAATKLIANSRMADGAGKNLYINAPNFSPAAGLMILQNANIQRVFLNMIGVEDWVTECQGEPWEKNGVFPLRTEYPSASPESAYGLARTLGGRGHERVLLWGAEFWVKQMEMGNPRWMKKMDQLFQAA